MAKSKVAASNTERWQLADGETVLASLNSRMQGLNLLEVEASLRHYGSNDLRIKKRLSQWRKFLKRFKSPLIIVLFLIGSLSWLFNDLRSAIIIYAMILLSVITDFFQENKSETAVEKLVERVISKVEVIRDGRREMIKPEQVVVGDILCLSVGSVVPADGRLVQADDLFVDESSLTGEAFPAEKTAQALKKSSRQLSEQSNLIFAGTNVVSGYGLAVIVATGRRTIFGGLIEKLAEPQRPTEFELGVNRFSNLIVKIIVLLVAGIFILNSGWSGRAWLDSLTFSLALAVGLTPELLPMIMSLTLARGSQNMAKHGVIAKRLNSIHDFGGMDVLCTDKTGTLTNNKIELVKHLDLSGRTSDELLKYAYLNSHFQSGMANPLDEAVMHATRRQDARRWLKLDETPFDFSRRRLSVILEKNNQAYLISKGAPEGLLPVCSDYLDADGQKPLNAQWRKAADRLYRQLSQEGYRVLAVAYKPVERRQTYGAADEHSLILLGLIAFLDPPKVGAKQALDLLEAQNIEIKIITGDNELVTANICKKIGLNVKGVLNGEQLEALSEAALRRVAEGVTIFARMSPIQKARIVSAIKANNHSVGYLGDGINDALPLKAADVGISVNNAAAVAKEAADLILLTKDLKALSLGVTEGRKTFGNTIKFILMGLSSNFGNMFSVAAASFVLPFLPMRPIQILLNNFLYDFSQVAIPLDNVDEEYITKPKRWDFRLIKKFMITFGLISSMFDITTFYIMLNWFKANEALFQTAWFIESLATQALVIFIIRTRRLPFIQSRPNRWLALSVFSLVALAAILPWTPAADYFFFVTPGWSVMAAITAIVVVYLLCVESIKRLIFRSQVS